MFDQNKTRAQGIGDGPVADRLKGDYSHDLSVMKVQMDQICDALKSTLR